MSQAKPSTKTVRKAVSTAVAPVRSGGDVAKVFMSGRSQAVRLPKAYRFDTREVTIQKDGDAIILRPRRDSHAEWWARVEAALDAFEGMPDSIERDQQPAREPPSFD